MAKKKKNICTTNLRDVEALDKRKDLLTQFVTILIPTSLSVTIIKTMTMMPG